MGCAAKSSTALDARTEALLTDFWPPDSPFPRGAPWLGAVVDRSTFGDFVARREAEAAGEADDGFTDELDRVSESASVASWWKWLHDYFLGPCSGGSSADGWADCQMQCGHLFPGSKGWCRAVAPDCACTWCECHNFDGGPRLPGDEEPYPGDGPIIIT